MYNTAVGQTLIITIVFKKIGKTAEYWSNSPRDEQTGRIFAIKMIANVFAPK
jgi:hypothetical protein